MTTSNDPLRLRVRIDATPAAVYKALTDADTLTEWFADSADVSLPDGRYEFWGRYTPQGDRPRQRLIAAEQDRSLAYTWDLDGSAPSTVEIAIEALTNGGALVAVAHTGAPSTGTAGPTALDCFWHVSLANLAAHCEGIATMPPFDFSVPAQGDALVRTVIDAPPEEVFASLLDPATVGKWARGKASIEPVVGGRYDFGRDHGPAKITQLEQDKVLAYSWRSPDGPDTTVRWTLRSSRGSTYLTLVHSGFADDGMAERYRQEWPSRLVEMKRLLELGERWEPLRASAGS